MSEQTINHRGYTIEVYNDNFAESPDRIGDDSQVFLVAFDHRNCWIEKEGYSEGLVSAIFNRGYYEDGSFSDEAKEAMQQFWVFELDAYIHSGVVLRLGSLADPKKAVTDRSIFGAIFLNKKDFNKKQAEEFARNYLGEWNDYLIGNVWGCKITDAQGQEVDRHSNYFGDPEEYLIPDAKDQIDQYIVLYEKEQQQKTGKGFKHKQLNGINVHIKEPAQ